MHIYIDNDGNKHEDFPLKPCPLCGGAPELTFIGNSITHTRSVKIKCKVCGVLIINSVLKNSHGMCLNISVQQWNKRVLDNPNES